MNLFEDTRTVSYQPIGEDAHDMPASPQEAEMAGDQAEFISMLSKRLKTVLWLETIFQNGSKTN